MNEHALLYVLLLAAVAVGWLLGYRFAHQAKKKDVPDFIPTVEFLLSEANDASLERLLNVPALDDNAIDLFLKLGRALRDKGEADRAVQLHQALFARTDLPRAQQLQVELELAIDYLRAGLLDRAERLLQELLHSKGRIHEQAARYLVELYEEEGEWQNILDLYQQRKLPHHQPLEKRVAHAVCELAEQAAKSRHYLDTQKLCRLALKIDGQCARAYVVQGNLAYGQDEPNEAIRCYLRAVDVDPQAIISVLNPLCDSFSKTGDTSGLMAHLGRQWHNSQYVPVLMARTQALATQEGPEQAVTALLKELAQIPSNQGFFALVELVVQYRLQLDKSQLLSLYGILRRIVEHEPKFLCKSCGFKATEFHWRCPSCKDWSSISPFVPQLTRSKLDL